MTSGTTDNYRLRLVLHGAVVLLAGLLSGLPTVVETFGGETERYWHTAHEALIMMGVWMLAMASVRVQRCEFSSSTKSRFHPELCGST